MREPSGPGIRNDCGAYAGFEVPLNYDPIISKLIVHAENRGRAVTRMIQALEEYVLLGIKTPIPFLIDILKSTPFQKGETTTDFIETHFGAWQPRRMDIPAALLAYLADAFSAKSQKGKPGDGIEQTLSPWQTLGDWRGY